MSSRLPARLCLVALLAGAAAGHAADPEDAAPSITVYRCVGADGRVTLGDVPCAADAREEVRTMQRPQDGAPLPPLAARPAAEAAAPAPQVVVARAPQPMYECVTPDGERYTSESGEGNPRWVPLWTLGFGRRPGGRPDASGAAGALNEWAANRPLGGAVGAPRPRPPAIGAGSGGGGRPDRPGRPGHIGHAMGPGTWVRDTCHPLPQQEVCARLADRREAIRRRFFNAQETERNALRTEERAINARLAADCVDH